MTHHVKDLKDLGDLAAAGDVVGLQDVLGDLPVSDISEELERLDKVDRAVAFRTLNKGKAMGVFESFDPVLQRELLDALREDATLELFADLDPDVRTGVLDELPATVARRLLQSLSPTEREKTTELLGYPQDSVGRRMTPELITIPADLTVGQALTRVRERGEEAETIYLLPVVGPGRELVGVVSLRRLLLTDDDADVSAVMNAPVMIEATADKEQAARLVQEEGLIALPVVDREGRVVGLFTVDDAMRVLESEESEDIARGGATEPLRRPYLTSSIFTLVRTRVVWLLVLIVAAALTVNVLEYFEATLAEALTLALFIPLLIDTAGNVGAQASTTVVRALAVDHLRFRDLPRVMLREGITGLSLGTILAIIAFIVTAFFFSPDIAAVLALSLVLVCTFSTIIGSVIPIIAQRLGVDPAVVSAPFITTIADTTGLITYFLVAQAILGL